VKAIFLDRDGTINTLIRGRENPKHVCPWDYSEFRYIDGVKEAVDSFRACGYNIHVVTNQPDIDDGYTTEETMNKIHEDIANYLHVDSIQAARTRGTDTYKPNPGMINNVCKDFGVNREKSWMIGDTWRDVVSGHRAGVRTIYLGGAYVPPEEYKDIQPTHIAIDLKEAALIIQQIEGGR
jgi:D-glycero-D-manno-heptose 1,7-bisphosphate phosphatase